IVTNPADSDSRPSLMQSPKPQFIRGNRRWVRTTVRWGVTAALFTWLSISTDWQSVWGAFRTASIPWLFIASGVYLVSQFASVARWELLVRAAKLDQYRTKLLATYFAGMFVNICLPTTIGGDALKVVRIGGAENKRSAAATVVADRASGLAA